MALLHIDGFENFDYYTEVLRISGYVNNSMAVYDGGRFGYGKYIGNGSATNLTREIPESTTLFMGVAAAYANVGLDYSSTYPVLSFLDSASSSQIDAYLGIGNLIFRRGTTELARYSELFSDTWYYIAIKLVVHDTNGALEVWINGVKEIDLTNIDTKNTDSSIKYVKLGARAGAGNKSYYDDWYIADDSGTVNNTLIPEARVVALMPTADTAQKDFTASTGSDNYAMVDELGVDDDTSYVYASTNGAKDIYDLGNLPAGVDTVYGISTCAYARKDNTDAVLFDFGVKSGATESFSTGHVMATNYLGFLKLDNVDPNTSGAWSVSAVNALQCGFTTTI
jgi:hypothetical protein